MGFALRNILGNCVKRNRKVCISWLILYIVIMNGKNSLKTDLVSIFQKQILDKTRIQHHWAGRNSRGVAQFDGQALEYFLKDDKIKIEIEKAKRYLIDLLDEDEKRGTFLSNN